MPFLAIDWVYFDLENWYYQRNMVEHEEQETEGEETLHEAINSQEREKRRLASKPYIDHLDDAVVVVDGRPTFLVKAGQRVIIERTASMLVGRPWLDTRSYLVESVDQADGTLRLVDEEMKHQATSNFITGVELGYRFKCPPKKGAALPRKNKAAPKEKVVEEKPQVDKNAPKERRVYATRGIIHTRIKGQAYLPQGETKAADGDRLMTVHKDKNLVVTHQSGWTEMWVPGTV